MTLAAQDIPTDIVTPFCQKTEEYHYLQGSVARLTYGLSHCGYDVRIKQGIWLWPLVGRLASTVERFKMPNNVVGRVHDKSSWARRMVAVQNTVIEPGWEGYLTLELSNNSWKPIYIPAGAPIAQILFDELSSPVEGYSGKYQNQNDGPQKAL